MVGIMAQILSCYVESDFQQTPEVLEQEIGTVEWQAITVGYSDDVVYRLRGASTRYLKVGENSHGDYCLPNI